MKNNNLMNILVVDDERDHRETLCLFFESVGYQTGQASSGEEALSMIENEFFPIVVTDMMMDGMSGIDLLKILKSEYHDEIEVIMVTGYGSIETAVETMKIGAFSYFIKSHDPAELIEEVRKAENCINIRRRMDTNNEKFSNYLFSRENAKMAKIWAIVDKVANSGANVLITGESGSGKEIIAQRIHYMSSRKELPFIPINCQAIPRELIEAELFGYEKGAFTGADKKYIGKLERSNGGTVFLDEIGDMSLDVQVKLLRVLETRKIERVGSSKVIDVDFRLICATNRDIEKSVREGGFREDLFYRINTFLIKVPPLRERREDIMPLIKLFVSEFSMQSGKAVTGIDDDTKNFLLNYSYPGNIRELRNIIERLVILVSDDGILRLSDNMYRGKSISEKSGNEDIKSYKSAKRYFEYAYIKDVLNKTEGNITKAAEKMGISRRQLFNKIKELDIE